MQIIKCLVRAAIFVTPLTTFSQSVLLPQGSRTQVLMERLEIKRGKDTILNFSSLLPYSRRQVVRSVESHDSLWSQVNVSKVDRFNMLQARRESSEWASGEREGFYSAKPLFKTFFRNPANLFEVDNPDFYLSINPVLQLRLGRESEDDATLFYNARGFVARGLIARKVGFHTYLAETQERGPRFMRDWVDTFRAVPGAGFIKTFKNTGRDYLDARGYITFNAAKYIDFQFGYDRHFIGNGFRSLYLSDFANNYMFLRTNLRVWRLNYLFQLMELTSQYKRDGNDNLLPRKYAAVHHLSFNVPKWLTVGIFESVVFGRQDHFEFLYLNPVIFLRPVEQQAGSPDNALVGIDVKANFLRRFQVYSQLVFDEFKLDEIRSGNGWWANKWGLQLGGKYIDAFGVRNLDLQGELNWVRPFMYSHYDTIANYTHYNQPLAHPLGANFREVIAIARYQPLPRLMLEGKIIAWKQGLDSAGLNYGSNIFKSNTTRVDDYGFSIGSGREVTAVNAQLWGSYELMPNLYVEAGIQYRKYTDRANTTMFTGGLRWNMFRREYSY